jgi:hypothetical protein
MDKIHRRAVLAPPIASEDDPGTLPAIAAIVCSV